MDDGGFEGVEVGQGLSHIVKDVDFDVEWQGLSSVEEARETLVHELHYDDR